MKKTILGILMIFCFGFTGEPVKTFKVEADLQSWSVVLDVIDHSVSDPNQRIAARNLIEGQIQKQMSDTTQKK